MRSVIAVGLTVLTSVYGVAVTRTAERQAQPSAARNAEGPREAAYRANNTGVAYLEQFNYQSAERAFREALKLSPDLAIARLNLAIALFYGSRPADALAEAQAAVKLLPELPQTHYVLGLIERAENRVDEAAAAFARVLQLDPSDAGAKTQLGQIHLQKREYDRARPLLEEALAAEPYNVTAAYSLALALTRSGAADEGRRAMQRFETLRDSAYGVTYSLTYLGQGRYGEAVASTGAEGDLVAPGIPAVTFSEAPQASLPATGGAPGARGGVTLFDADADGDLDLVDTGAAATRFFRNTKGRFANETARAGVGALADGVGAVAGDYDNDDRPDLLVVRESGSRLLRQTPDGTFEDVTQGAALPAPPAAAAAGAFADVDHDGDLDMLVVGRSPQLLRNNGDGTFADITDAAGLAAMLEGAVAAAPTDYDARRDIDLLVAAESGTVLFRNMRDGTFRDSAAAAGLPTAGSTAVAVADVNKDGLPDLFLARRTEAGAFALSEGQGTFRVAPAPDGTRGARAGQFFDYDNDGVLDLATLTDRGLRLFRNIGGGKWLEVTDAARLSAAAGDGPPLQAMAVGDVDGDGDQDVVLRDGDGRLRLLSNTGGTANRSLRVQLSARVSNRSAVGAKVEMRAGSLRQALETSAATPAVAPADVAFGLGRRQRADVVRVLWPSGILQAETSLEAQGPSGARASAAPLAITELDRKPSSCPYLFTWNGTRFEFLTDFMGGGEMGGWLAPDVWTAPDPDEYVRITAEQLRPRDGRYELRVTNELEEALFVDRVQLLVVDHAADVQVFPNEGLRSPPRPPFALTAVRGARPPVRAVDEHGRDVRPQLSALDRRYVDGFDLLPIRGYAEPHEIILDAGSMGEDPVLLMTGWTDYAFSSDNVAASQRSLVMSPPSLQVRDASGAWRTAIDEIGFPVGRPQTVVVDLAGKFLSSSREVRILTNMRIYWDQILVAQPDRRPVSTTRLDPVGADLRWRGFSAEVTPDGREPFSYDYGRVSAASPWKVLVGRYTREGEVGPLLRTVDDLFVISRPGDEMALSFPALPAPAGGRTRTFLLHAHGYSKEMNPRSARPDTVGPLPFNAMSRYPYGPREHYPRTPRHREYLEKYNTRIVHRAVPSIDAAAAGGIE